MLRKMAERNQVRHLAHAANISYRPRRGKESIWQASRISVDFEGALRFAGSVSFLLGVALLCLGGDAATGEDPEVETPATASGDAPVELPFLAEYAPAAIEGPGLRLPEPLTRLYIDASYARTNDLSGLPLVAGSAHNYRFAAGGSLAWHRFSFDAEVAFSNITTIDVTQVPGGVPLDVDKHQTATSLGDTRLGVTWTQALDDAGQLVGGFGLRGRFPTHTVVFQFHLIDMVSLGKYVFPYYFHVEPTAILAGWHGPFGFVVNEGVTLMTGPDGNFNDLHIIVPNLFFWSAYYALVFAPVHALALSAELGTNLQLNHVSAMYFDKVNGLFSATLDVDLQVHFGRFRVDAVAHRGLTRDSEIFGVLQYSGTNSVTLRLGTYFN